MKKVLSVAAIILFSVSGLSLAQGLTEGDEATVSDSTRVDLMNLEAVLDVRNQRRFSYGNSCLINPNGKLIVEASADESDPEVLVRYRASEGSEGQCPSNVIFYLPKEQLHASHKVPESKSHIQVQIAEIIVNEKQ